MPRCPSCHRRLLDGAMCPRDRQRVGHAPGPLDDDRIAIDGFTIAEPLGFGGFATTYAGRAANGRDVAIKVSRAPSRAAAERLAGEARALVAVGRPAAPEVLAIGESRDGRPYLAMERIDGELWANWLARADGPASAADIVRLGSQLSAAVSQAHDRAISHGDLKPENVFVCPGQARLIDFSVGTAGTVEYAAPEQIAGQPARPASDVYAIGVMLYELATGRPPFVGDRPTVEYGHSTLTPLAPSNLSTEAAPFDDIIAACLAKQPDQRPGLAEVISALNSARTSGSPAASQAAVSMPRRAVERTPVVLLAVWPTSSGADGHERVVRAGGFAIGHKQGGRLYGFTADSVDRPARAAHRLASELIAFGHRVALHVAPITVRPRPSGPPLVAGRAVDPRSWLPTGDWTGLWTSREFDAACPRNSGSGQVGPMVGRSGELAAITDILEQVNSQRVPALVTVCGASGTGRTRMLAEFVRLGCQAMTGAALFAIDDDSPLDGEALRSLARSHPVIVTVDDAERVSDQVLDEIEYAAHDGHDMPIAVAIAADAMLTNARPAWGARVRRHARIDLDPLDRNSAMQMVAHLVEPAEYPPEEALAQLAARGDYLPGAIVRVCEEVHARGWIVPRSGGSHYLATDRLGELGHAASADWAAAAELGRLPVELADLARAAACLIGGFDREEVEVAVAALAERRGGLRADAQVGLFQLASRGLLRPLPGPRWQLDSEQLRAGIAATLSAEVLEHIDERVLAFVSRAGSDQRALAALAHHAERLGRGDRAASAHHLLALSRARAHRLVEADRHYSAALEHLDGGGRAAAQMLLGRGRGRYLLGHHREALDDLERAEQIARAAGDEQLATRALFEQATALDWAGDYRRSAARGQQAIERAGSGFEAERALAAGRAAWRGEDTPTAIEQLLLAALAAAASDDDDTRTVALLLLGPALVRAGRLDRAERCFEEVIDLCERAGDRLHLCAAYGNRMFLWSARKRPDLARADLRQAVVLARQVGHPGPERVATFNLAEDLYWSGENDDEALQLAQRSRFLQTRFVPYPAVEDALLVARIALAVGQDDVARDHLEQARRELPDSDWSDASQVFAAMIEAWMTAAPDHVWDSLVERAEAVMGGDDALEILYWAARSARHQRRADLVDRARQRLDEYPIWKSRYGALLAS